ncbi:MAG TPA: hypothetical protein VFV08_08940, partial [Puia sp.]|nr:hypothetical protein [Puia sp.]
MKIFGTGLFFAFLLTGCMNAVSRQEIVKNFYLMTVDVEEQSSLTYGDEKDGGNYGIVIGPAVFAVGYNDRFIIAKQHPWAAGKAVNKAVTNYYILPVG